VHFQKSICDGTILEENWVQLATDKEIRLSLSVVERPLVAQSGHLAGEKPIADNSGSKSKLANVPARRDAPRPAPTKYRIGRKGSAALLQRQSHRRMFNIG
jgi:hypothetical protein